MISMPIDEYYATYIRRSQAESHTAWIDCYQSQINTVTRSHVPLKLYKVILRNGMDMIVPHDTIVYIAMRH